jgi:predicted regulator of Ras-like GTPase activity (Roadblock/LC7/MglB family)
MSLIGTLKDLSLFNLVQLHCCERQQAQVSLVRADCEGRLIFAGGELVFAAVGGLAGEEAVHELLTWEDGDFRVDYEPAPVARNVQTPWSVLLLEGVRRLDEARAERDARLEATLRSMKGTDGLRGTVVTNTTGQVRAAATAGPAVAEAAMVAFLAGRLETIGGLLRGGACREVSVSGPHETIWIARRDGAYLACWLDGRAALHPVKRLLRPLLSWERSEARQGAADESSVSR